jgi:hypothetical protein
MLTRGKRTWRAGVLPASSFNAPISLEGRLVFIFETIYRKENFHSPNQIALPTRQEYHFDYLCFEDCAWGAATMRVKYVVCSCVFICTSLSLLSEGNVCTLIMQWHDRCQIQMQRSLHMSLLISHHRTTSRASFPLSQTTY